MLKNLALKERPLEKFLKRFDYFSFLIKGFNYFIYVEKSQINMGF